MNTSLSVDLFDAIFDPTGNPVFQNETYDGWPIKSNTGVIFNKPKFKQTIYQLASMTLKLLTMLSKIIWTAEVGACPALFE